jgi:hypothetical protein
MNACSNTNRQAVRKLAVALLQVSGARTTEREQQLALETVRAKIDGLLSAGRPSSPFAAALEASRQR